MKPQALTNAKEDLETIRQVSASLQISTDADAQSRDWATLLRAAYDLYTALEMGAKGIKESEKWMQSKTAERKADPILQYIRHARNARGHGLKSIISKGTMQSIQLRPGTSWTVSASSFNDFISQAKSQPNAIVNDTTWVTLDTVIDRGVEYPPPSYGHGTSHSRTATPKNTSLIVRGKLEILISEAEALVTG